jgi:hypothetical protein
MRIAALVALSPFAMSASPKAAPLISHGAYSEMASKSCGNSYSCAAIFSPIAASKTLIVHNLSCYVYHPPSVQPMWFRFHGNGRNVFIPLRNATTVSGARAYFLNETIFTPFAAGQTPTASLLMTALSVQLAVTCTIGGELRP